MGSGDPTNRIGGGPELGLGRVCADLDSAGTLTWARTEPEVNLGWI